MMKCFQIHANDNTAVLLEDGTVGDQVTLIGASNARVIVLQDDIAYGHKVAILDIQQGEPVLKYGINIGRSTQPVRTGEWLHLHNCASNFDERSSTLNVHTGTVTDTVYE